MSSPVEAAAPVATRSLVIASAPRTGSQLLSRTLRATGVVGDPRERLQPQDYDLARRRHQRTGGFGYAEYRDEVLAGATSSDGARCATLKINGMRWVVAMERSLDAELAALTEAQVMERLFPSPAWVFLRREDTARQAISWYRAATQETWRRTHDQSAPPPPVVEPVWERLAWLEANARNHSRRWREFFDANEITPIELTYEQLAGDLHGSVIALLAAVGQEAPAEFASYTPELAPMADGTSETWREHYLAMRETITASPLALRRAP